MPRRQLGTGISVAIAVVALAAWPMPAQAEAANEAGSKEEQDCRALVATIDRLIADKWAEEKVQPAPLAGDSEFLRRVSLDLAGKIPTVAETRDFLDDPSPDKRTRLVERLLQSPAYVNHFTVVWSSLLVPEADADDQARFLAPDFEAWLQAKITDNAGYDQIAREVVSLSLEGKTGRRGINPFQPDSPKPTPLAYYLAKEAKPENLAAGTARTFLGVRIECAQCHDHPFARWKREQFWGFAAFFGGVQQEGPPDQFGPVREISDRRELTIPGTERVVQASFLDGGEPEWKFRVGARTTLAEWMTSAENPYFARAGVNRLWAHFFGIGLVDPVDDLSDANPPSHPELLDELARQFAGHRFDIKFLIRALTLSRAYQLTSDATGATEVDPRLFARMTVRSLTADQLFDSIVQASARPFDNTDRFRRRDPYREEFVQKFAGREEKPTEPQTSILQALGMMNGRLIADSTNAEQGTMLQAIAESPFLDTAGKVETLFLATLNRRPTPDERDRLVAYIDRKSHERATESPLEQLKSTFGALVRRQGLPSSEKKALGDVFWSLLNSAEFVFNH